jgi:hypothetical protein
MVETILEALLSLALPGGVLRISPAAIETDLAAAPAAIKSGLSLRSSRTGEMSCEKSVTLHVLPFDPVKGNDAHE